MNFVKLAAVVASVGFASPAWAQYQDGQVGGDVQQVEIPAGRTINVNVVTNDVHLQERWSIVGWGQIDGMTPGHVAPPGHDPNEHLAQIYAQNGASGSFNATWGPYDHDLFFQVSCITKHGYDYIAHTRINSATPSQIIIGIDGTEDVKKPPAFTGLYNSVIVTFNISPPR